MAPKKNKSKITARIKDSQEGLSVVPKALDFSQIRLEITNEMLICKIIKMPSGVGA